MTTTGPHVLSYATPARYWTDALPIGNGRLGAMVFGPGPDRLDRWQLNDDTCWSGWPGSTAGVAASDEPSPEVVQRVRTALLAGDVGTAETEIRKVQYGHSQAYQPLAELTVTTGSPVALQLFGVRRGVGGRRMHAVASPGLTNRRWSHRFEEPGLIQAEPTLLTPRSSPLRHARRPATSRRPQTLRRPDLLDGASCAGRRPEGRPHRPQRRRQITLCRVLLGDEELDAGEVVRSRKLRLGYLRQHDPFQTGETVRDFLMRDSGQPDWRCGEVAWQFQFPDAMLDQPVRELSGGWQTRVKLAALLLHDPNLLILDEPTNFLDLRTQMLLEQFLRDFGGGCLVVSHDRAFLKTTCTHTLELSRGQLTMFPGDVDAYLANVEERREHDRRVNATTLSKRKQLETFIAKNRANASTASQARSKAKQLERLTLIEVAGAEATVRFSFPEVEAAARHRPCAPSSWPSAIPITRSPATCSWKSSTARASASSATTARARPRSCARSAARSSRWPAS